MRDQELEANSNSNLKAQILDEMKKFKEDQKGLIRSGRVWSWH